MPMLPILQSLNGSFLSPCPNHVHLILSSFISIFTSGSASHLSHSHNDSYLYRRSHNPEC